MSVSAGYICQTTTDTTGALGGFHSSAVRRNSVFSMHLSTAFIAISSSLVFNRQCEVQAQACFQSSDCTFPRCKQCVGATTGATPQAGTCSSLPDDTLCCGLEKLGQCQDGLCVFTNPQDTGESCVCSMDRDCTGFLQGEICCPDKKVCEIPIPDSNPQACGDPHMTGFHGQKFDFTGDDGQWYALMSDLPAIHLNMRVTSPVASLPEITYITGVSLQTTDADGVYHMVVISAIDPHSLESSCPVGVSPCLADGSLSVVADGESILFAPGSVAVAPGVAVAGVNIPGACRSFGFEHYWELKGLTDEQAGRKLSTLTQLQSMSDWILGDPTATNMEECSKYVANAVAIDEGASLFSHQSEHAIFQIATPAATIRLSHGRLHQLPMRDPTDQFDLPDHRTWQMNLGIDRSSVSIDSKGIIGETLVPTRDSTGERIMVGMKSIRGTADDYLVAGPLGVAFALDGHH